MERNREMHADSVDKEDAEALGEAAEPQNGTGDETKTRSSGNGASGQANGSSLGEDISSEIESVEYLDSGDADGEFDPPVRPAQAPKPVPEATGDAAVELSEAQNQIETLTREKSAIYDQLLRRQAEFENFRKRFDRERTEIYQRTRAEVLLELLPVLDNFERALMSLENSGDDPEALLQGVALIHKQFKDAVTKMGLQQVESVGKSFDPNLHEAITVEPTDEHEENTIIEEFQRGYKLGDRLLRPARVKVAGSPDR